MALLVGLVWLADKGWTVYEVSQDVAAIRDGTKTVEQVAKEKGEGYVTGIILGNIGRYGIQAVKQGGKWVQSKVFSRNGVGKSASVADSASFSTSQLDKKFKHAEDFGVVTTKKNSATLAQYQQAIQSHLRDPATYPHGTYQYVPDSIVHFNPTTNNVVVLGKNGDFITGWKLTPGTPQYDNFLNKGVLR